MAKKDVFALMVIDDESKANLIKYADVFMNGLENESLQILDKIEASRSSFNGTGEFIKGWRKDQMQKLKEIEALGNKLYRIYWEASYYELSYGLLNSLLERTDVFNRDECANKDVVEAHDYFMAVLRKAVWG